MSGIGNFSGVSCDNLFTSKSFSDHLSIMTPKKEFSQYMESVRQNRDSYVSDAASATAEASDEDIRRWAEEYDPENLSQEEYCSFVDELITDGVLTDSDKNYIGYSDMVCLGTLDEMIAGNASESYVTPAGAEPVESLSDAKGNARSWASAWKSVTIGSNSKSTFLERRVALFKKLSGIFDRMATIA